MAEERYATSIVPTEFGDEENSFCYVCAQKLGRLRLQPKHRCRVCNHFVCGSCSPSKVYLEADEKDSPQRACRNCVFTAIRAFNDRAKLVSLFDLIIEGNTLPDDIKMSPEFEAACQDIGVIQETVRAAELEAAKERQKQQQFEAICLSAVSACSRLNKVVATGGKSTPEVEPASVGPATAEFCKATAESVTAQLLHGREDIVGAEKASAANLKKIMKEVRRLQQLSSVQEAGDGSSLEEACNLCLQAVTQMEAKVIQAREMSKGTSSTGTSKVNIPGCFSCITG
uniref:FYVE-type domain-containing protein n=1 Tax=Noctiluca scintillans TaxID=2966 RepID=A0A7S0ZSM4_NOCSC|mmetsp:Transcript_17239/g.46667  ORF Transcript_17239/g.46667 Transcript_17239/m.46667 type:complete len:285 (+) Transcript_17239:52-906(+)